MKWFFKVIFAHQISPLRQSRTQRLLIIKCLKSDMSNGKISKSMSMPIVLAIHYWMSMSMPMFFWGSYQCQCQCQWFSKALINANFNVNVLFLLNVNTNVNSLVNDLPLYDPSGLDKACLLPLHTIISLFSLIWVHFALEYGPNWHV